MIELQDIGRSVRDRKPHQAVQRMLTAGIFTSEWMTLRLTMIITLLAASLTGCGDSVPLKYSTRADADAESVFARGWLPEIIPASSQAISMRNDLDLNTSNGEFTFDPSDYDEFVKHLKRTPSKDKSGFTAFSFEDWNFWVNDNKNRCQFYMRLSGDREPGEQAIHPGV